MRCWWEERELVYISSTQLCVNACLCMCMFVCVCGVCVCRVYCVCVVCVCVCELCVCVCVYLPPIYAQSLLLPQDSFNGSRWGHVCIHELDYPHGIVGFVCVCVPNLIPMPKVRICLEMRVSANCSNITHN